MNKPNITLNDVLKNRLSATCNAIAYEIMKDVTKRDGYNIKKNNSHLLFENEKYIMDLFDLLSNTMDCLSSIDNACIFMTHFYEKNHFEKHQISFIDYNLYHYDVLCYKISTLKDLYFKLVNFLYNLNLKDKSCNWTAIEREENIINKPLLFYFLRENFKHLSTINNRRNRSAHEGKVEHKAFKDISSYVFLTMHDKTNNNNISKDLNSTYGPYLEVEIKKSQQAFLEEVEIYRYNTFVFTRCILCSLSEKFIQTINSQTKNKYSEIIKKAEHKIIENWTKGCCNINGSLAIKW